jgi:hypothetical protein
MQVLSARLPHRGMGVTSAHPSPVWRFYERRHPHSLWHGDYLEKVILMNLDQTAYPLTLMIDNAADSGLAEPCLAREVDPPP